jgi:hypothetical protein
MKLCSKYSYEQQQFQKFPGSNLSRDTNLLGSAIAQATSRWFPTAEARVHPRVWSSGICGGRSGAETGFLRELQFPLPIFIPPNSPSSSPGAGTIGQKLPTCRMEPVWTPPLTMRIKKKKNLLLGEAVCGCSQSIQANVSVVIRLHFPHSRSSNCSVLLHMCCWYHH